MFSVGISYDPADTDGELDFNFSDISPPLSALPEGDIVTISFTAKESTGKIVEKIQISTRGAGDPALEVVAHVEVLPE